jgi:hypothetical protein
MRGARRFSPAYVALAITGAVGAALISAGRYAATGGERALTDPVWLEPAPSPAIAPQPLVFRWTAILQADRYRLRVGTAPGRGDILRIGGLRETSYEAGELPGDRPLYARVSACSGGRWHHAYRCFTLERTAAEWVYPKPGSPVVEVGRPFEWTSPPAASEYRLVVGASPGLADIFDRALGKQTRVDVPNLAAGRPLFARLFTRVRGRWYSRDSDFAVELGYRAARLTHPRPGSGGPRRAHQFGNASRWPSGIGFGSARDPAARSSTTAASSTRRADS